MTVMIRLWATASTLPWQILMVFSHSVQTARAE